MALLNQSPFEWLSFDDNGALTDTAAPGRIDAALAATGGADLVVISHGWKTDQVGAGELYTPLWENAAKALNAEGGPAPQKIVVAGVCWPSLTFKVDFDTAAATTASGGTLAIPPAVTSDGDLAPAILDEVVERYRELVSVATGVEVAAAAAQTAAGYDDASAGALLAALKAAAGFGNNKFDSELTFDAAGFSKDPVEILDLLAPLLNLSLNPSVGTTLDLGTALSNAIQGPRAAVARLLNQFTYFIMKQRAGTIGQRLGADVLSGLTLPRPTRLHLIGHSFGARVVTAAAAALNPPANLILQSLTLLQGAYSHNGMASNFDGGKAGAFASVLSPKRVAGPISMTHTHNDSACTIAYPLASRLSRDETESLGDADDLFGAMGANGAQHLAADDYAPDQAMTKGKATYMLAAGKVNRVLADRCVEEHMDVTNPDVGALVASAVRS